ncbi:unnamed protein product [Parajaminaea phylloscopi]
MPPRRASAGRNAAKRPRISYAEDSEDTDNDAQRRPSSTSSASHSSAASSGSEFKDSSRSSSSDGGSAGHDSEYDDDDDDDDGKDYDSKGRKPDRKGAGRPARGRNGGHDVSQEVTGGEVTSVTKLTPAPTQPHRSGKIGRPVVEFLAKLANPVYNDREWFHANDRVWRWVKDDWEAFIAHFLEAIMEDVDETVPYLPVKDLSYRIHRDIRFSNDKTPYKKTLMATFSRGGRKGPFAGYHLCIRANGESALHAGIWDPPAPYLATIRRQIDEESDGFTVLHDVIADDKFVECFGPPQPLPSKGAKGSLWGRDELKSAPKGFDKSHPRIHLLRLKSFCVSRYFPDERVVQDDFHEQLIKAARLAQPFVEALNEMIHPSPPPPPGARASRS